MTYKQEAVPEQMHPVKNNVREGVDIIERKSIVYRRGQE